MIKAILAVDKNGLMGNNLELPWKNRSDTKWDLQNFKSLTINQIVFMGYNTCLSLQKALPQRINVAEITRKPDSIIPSDFVQTASLEEFISTQKTALQQKDIFIIGGKKILEKYCSQIQELYLTRFDFEEKGNVYFPEEILSAFKNQEIIKKTDNGKIIRYSR